jgi:hypothetical protein
VERKGVVPAEQSSIDSWTSILGISTVSFSPKVEVVNWLSLIAPISGDLYILGISTVSFSPKVEVVNWLSLIAPISGDLYILRRAVLRCSWPIPRWIL